MKPLPFRGLLFDLDGTLVDSIAAVDRSWRTWATEYGLDADDVVTRIHGKRAIDSIAILAPHVDLQTAFHRLEYLEATDTVDVVALAGAFDFISTLQDVPWGIVTSGSVAIAEPRLAAGLISRPKVFVTANDVSKGKPAPDPFLMGAKLLGIDPADIIAFEDTLAGIRSAKTAGMTTVGLSDEAAQEADFHIKDYQNLSVFRADDGSLTLGTKNPL